MKKALTLLAMTTIGLGTMNAWATDNRTQPGLNCVQVPDGTGLPHGTPWLDGWGAFENLSSSATMILFCPVLRDNQSTAPSSITVDFTMNNNNFHSAECQFVTVSVSSGAASESWGAASWVPTLCNYPSPCSLSVGTSGLNFSGGTEFIECLIPPATTYGTSAVLAYNIQE